MPRYFRTDSIWNRKARDKGTVTHERLPDFVHSYADTLEVTRDTVWSKPIFYAKDGDPAYLWTDTNGWPSGSIAYQGERIPMPKGAKEATGSDGHLCIVTADRRYAYDFWRANVATRKAECIVRWDLHGSGVAERPTTSARGSGFPLINTVVRVTDDYQHAGCITVPNVESSYTNPPATHSDGHASNGLHYGDLYVLRYDFPVQGNAATQALIKQLRTYGAYIGDQGASLGIDARPGGTLPGNLPIRASDFRKVRVA